MEEETPPAPVDGADAGRGRRGGPAALLVEVIAGGLLTGGGGAVDAMFRFGCFFHLLILRPTFQKIENVETKTKNSIVTQNTEHILDFGPSSRNALERVDYLTIEIGAPIVRATMMMLSASRPSSVASVWRRNLYPILCGRGLSSAVGNTSNNESDEIPTNISPIHTSLALSVHFRHPDLGMKDFEILSRATAFLLNVDPPNPGGDYPSAAAESSTTHNSQGHVQKSAFPHLKENRDIRKELLRKQHYSYDPASGPPRLPHQLNWLEFCPTNFRPKVHVVASSHVISPWLWPKYYGQDWLQIVTQEHVRYSLEVWSSNEGLNSSVNVGHDGKLEGGYKPIAKFALNPYPIHHPTEMDLAVIHLKQEEEALKQMMKLGIQPLNLPTASDFENDDSPVFEPGEKVLFQGFEVYEANMTDQETLSDTDNTSKDGDDERVFHPYSSLGTLSFASPDRFLSQTKGGPLPEGLCGGPVIQIPASGTSGKQPPMNIRGVVEGIVPTNHENSQIAGHASFLPSYRIREFVDFAERIMLEQIIDSDLFQRCVEMKERKNKTRGTVYGEDGNILDSEDDDNEPLDPKLLAGIEGTGDDKNTPQLDREFQDIVSSLHEKHSPEEVDAILATVERERKEVAEILEKEGGDVDDVIERVRRKTYEEKEKLMKEIMDEMTGPSKKS